MRTLALSDEILMKVDKAARYIGGEVNSVMKDKNDVDIRFAMCFPDVYEIGMSNLGMMILYNMFNEREDVWCERVFSPWMDLDKIMREEHIPLFALESQEPVKEFDFLGITLGYEMCYTNVLQVLDLSHVSLLAKDRKEDDPIVIGGGACAYNPEPIAEFFDMFYIGEGETVYDQLLDIYKENKKNGGSRWDYLAKAAEVEGIYVPAFYDVTYKEDDGNVTPIGVKIGLFQFTNPSGLEKLGGNYLAETDASGIALNEDADAVGKKSQLKQKYLEASNVEVATEMVNLITAQRAYELCSKAITTSDTMMEQANALKR